MLNNIYNTQYSFLNRKQSKPFNCFYIATSYFFLTKKKFRKYFLTKKKFRKY